MEMIRSNGIDFTFSAASLSSAEARCPASMDGASRRAAHAAARAKNEILMAHRLWKMDRRELCAEVRWRSEESWARLLPGADQASKLIGPKRIGRVNRNLAVSPRLHEWPQRRRPSTAPRGRAAAVALAVGAAAHQGELAALGTWVAFVGFRPGLAAPGRLFGNPKQ